MSDEFKIKKCRSCGYNKLIRIISLGNQYVTNFVNTKEEQKNIPQVPLNLVLCENCKLLQLEHNAPNDSMWGDQYWYKSNINRLIREDLRDITEKAIKISNPGRESIVIDIGCNDGTLLDSYNKNKGLVLVGFEPSKNVAMEAEKKGFQIIQNFFNAEDFKKNFGERKAKIITAISMFYDLEDPNPFV